MYKALIQRIFLKESKSELFPSKETYYYVVQKFGKNVEQLLRDNFVSYLVVGSLARGDVVPGWSDIDSVLVVNDKDQKVLKIVETVKSEIENDNSWLMSEYGSFFTVWIVTREEFLYGRDRFPDKLNLIDFKKIGRTIVGEDLSSLIMVPEIDRKLIEKIFFEYWSALKKMDKRGFTPFWKGRNAIAYPLDAARYALLISGIYVSAKKDIVEKFELNFPNFIYLPTLKKAYNLREKWVKIKDDHEILNQMYNEALQFLNELSKKILKSKP